MSVVTMARVQLEGRFHIQSLSPRSRANLHCSAGISSSSRKRLHTMRFERSRLLLAALAFFALVSAEKSNVKVFNEVRSPSHT